MEKSVCGRLTVSLYSDCSRLLGVGFSELALGADVIVLGYVKFCMGFDSMILQTSLQLNLRSH